MADNTIDTLDIQVNSSTNKAIRSLEQLSKKLSGLDNALKQVNSGGLRNYAREIGRVAGAAKPLNGLKINIPNITGLSTQLKKLSEIDLGKLGATSQAIKDIGTGLSGLKGLGTISFPKLDKKNVNSVVSAVEKFEKIDSSKISDSVNAVSRVAQAVSVLNSADFNDSKVIPAINAVRRLIDTDVEGFDTGKLEGVATVLSKFSSLPDVSSGVNRFLSSLQKLVNAGDKVLIVSGSLPNLAKELKKTINSMARVQNVSDSTNLFVQSIGRLASAGDKTGKTAGQLEDLAKETKKFFEAMKDAPKISENTIRMTQALAQLASAGGKVNTATNTITGAFNRLSSAANKVASLVVDAGSKLKNGIIGIVSAFRSIGNNTSGINKATFSLGNLIKMAAGLQVVRKLVDFGKSAVTLGSDITEVENVVDVAFGSMADKAYEFASTATEKFGLSELAAKNYSGTMMAMLKSSGVAQKSAAEMSTTLAGLSGDFASFFNIDTDTAFYKLRSGISGEVEPLKQLGINLSVANLQSYALSQGITASYNSMSQAEKVLLRYNYILSVTGDAQGDFARTSGTWANQVRLLTLNLQSLAAVLGQGIIAGILPAIQALNAFISKLMQAANTFRDFMYVLMGKKLKGATSGIVNDFAGLDDTSADLSGLQNAGDDASSGLDNATDSAKALKKALSVLPFDELNQLTDNSDNTGTTSSKKKNTGTSGLTDGFASLQNSIDDALNTEETPINKWASKIRKAFLKHDWEGIGKTIADMLNIGMQNIYDVISWNKVGPKITQFTDAFTRSFNSLVDHIGWGLMGQIVGAGITTLVKTFNLLTDPSTGINFEGIGSGLSMGLRGIFNEIPWSEFGNALGNGFMISWRLLDGFVQDMSRKNDSGITGWQELGTSLAETMNGIFEKVDFSKISSVLTTGINGAFDALAQFTKDFEWDDFADNLGTGISTFISDMNWEKDGASLETFLDNFLGSLIKISETVPWDEFGSKVGTLLSTINWGEHLAQIETVLANVLGGIWSGLGDTSAGKFVQAIVAFGIAEKLLPVINTIGAVFGADTLVGSIATNATTAISNGFSNVIGLFGEGGAIYEALSTGALNLGYAFEGLTGIALPVEASFGIIVTAIVAFAASVKNAWDTSETFRSTVIGAFTKVKDSLVAAFNKIKDALLPTIDSVKNLASTFVDMYNNSPIKPIVVLFESLAASIVGTTLSTAIDAVSTAFSGIIKVFQGGIDLISSVFEILKGIFTLDFSTVAQGFKDVGSAIATAFNGIGTIFLGVGKDIISGLYNGIKDSISTVGDWLKEHVFSPIVDNFKNLFGIHSPSTVFAEYGGYLMEGLMNGINGLIDDVTGIFDGIASKIKSAWEWVTGKTSSDSETMAKNVKGSVEQMQSDVNTSFAEIEKNAGTSSQNANSSISTNWGNSSREATLKAREMKVAVSTELGNMDKSVRSHFESQYNIAYGKWESIGRDISNYISGTMNSDIGSALGSFVDTIRNSFNDMYNIGHNAAQSLYNGMKEVSMPTLSYRISEWKTHNLGNGKTSQTPVYSPNWYAIGGVFTKASVIGVGEAGQEAVLPLTNRKVMKNIADNIMASYDGSAGLSKEELAAAVERGVVTAMMNNGGFGGSSPEYIMNSIKVNERELARIVTKAQSNTEYRMNPSPAY